MNEPCWPSEPGVYALLLELATPHTFAAGRLGLITLPAGGYAYVGSARGPGGLRGRLARHLRPEKRLHWHIDALTQRVAVAQVCWEAASEPLECRWVQTLLRLPGATAPAPGFGSSDCRAGCPSHLIRLPDGLPAAALRTILQDHSPEGIEHDRQVDLTI
jgi:Uri superfamily endonuclease